MSDSPSRAQSLDRARVGYIPGIDGLRAVAVLSVLVFHIDERALPGGFVGVDLFFVISGFVVSMATSGIEVATFGELVRAFYRRRVIRILPAALLFLLLMELLSVLFIPSADLLGVPDMTAAASAAGLGNIVLWQMAGDYFSRGVALNPFTHMWSLGVEEQFYLLFPVFAVGIFVRRDAKSGRRWSLMALALLAALSLGLAAWRTTADQTFAFYMLPARLWELAAGVVLFAAIGERGVKLELPHPAMTTIASLLGAGLLVASLGWVSPIKFPFPGAIPPTLAAILLIAVVALAPESFVARVLSLKPLRYIGRVSYSLYLWHWGVIVLMRWTTGLETLPQMLTAAALSLVLADLSYRFVERPVRSSRWVKKRRDPRVLACALGSSALTVCLIVGLVAARPALSLSGVSRNPDIWRVSLQARAGRCHADRTKSGLQNGGVLYRFAPVDCATSSSAHRLIVLGDSHVWAYQRLSGTFTRDTGTTSMMYMATGCPVLPGVSADTPAMEARCSAFIRQSLQEITQIATPGDVVFLPGLRTPRYREYWEDSFPEPKPAKVYTAAMIQAAADQLRPLLDRGVNVVIEAPKPVFNFAPLRCSDWFDRANPHCRVPPISRAEALARRAPLMAVLQNVVAADPRLTLWDPFPFLCSASARTCSPYRDGYPLVTDGDHLTAYANDLLAPAFEAQVLRR